MTLSRRGFIRSAGLLFAAPAIVRVASIMPVRAEKLAAARPWTDNGFIYQTSCDVAFQKGQLTQYILDKMARRAWVEGVSPVAESLLNQGSFLFSSKQKAPMGTIPMSALEDPAGFAPGDLVTITPRDE